MVDGRLADGSRINAIIPPLALDGALVSIRRFGAKPLTAADLVAKGAMTEEMVRFLSACVLARLNVLISGGTGSGKTTLLNGLSAFIPTDERVITIEDAAELRMQQRPRRPAGDPAAQRRGHRRGQHARPGEERLAHAAGSHRHRRVPRRRGAGHAPGDEHRPRGQPDHHSRQRHAATRWADSR